MISPGEVPPFAIQIDERSYMSVQAVIHTYLWADNGVIRYLILTDMLGKEHRIYVSDGRSDLELLQLQNRILRYWGWTET